MIHKGSVAEELCVGGEVRVGGQGFEVKRSGGAVESREGSFDRTVLVTERA